jgi:peptidoglycan/LPS O-acetylase OafA/YrhL
MKTLSTTLSRGNNNFDLIRLVAAISVMLGHSYGIQVGSPMESMLAFSYLESFGSLAVYSFFMISGMLVSASFEKNSSVPRFVGLRVLRIWPGAIACALFILLVVGPIFSKVDLVSYFSDSRTYSWLARNTFLLGRVGGPLPGLFESNHLKSLVNATVWTLPIELKCYVIVLGVGLLGVIGSKWWSAFAIGICAIIFALFVKYPTSYFTLGDFFVLPIAYSFYPVPFFLLGMLLYAFRANVLLSWKLAVPLFIAYMFVQHTFTGTILFYLSFIYGLLWLASVNFLLWLKPKHDYSYGIYLYGFTIQQIIASFCPLMNNYVALAIALPITVLLAALSWHWIEKPALAKFRAKTKVSDAVTTTAISSGV